MAVITFLLSYLLKNRPIFTTRVCGVGNVFGHVCLSVCLSVCLCVCLSVCVSICLCFCLFRL